MSVWADFRKKGYEKIERETAHCLKRIFHFTNRKMKNIIKVIFIPIAIHPNTKHFPRKTIDKSALESFVLISGHLSLKILIPKQVF